MLKRSLLAAAVLAAGTTLVACGGGSDDDSASGPSCTYTKDGSGSDVKLPPSEATESGKVPVTINSSVGDLVLTLDADAASCTVNSFVSLARQGFYDGVFCHRIGDPAEFPMLQCGDPTSTDQNSAAMAGGGGPGYAFADELTGDETYSAGTLAMANAGPDTNGSQFFMVFGDIGLNPAYTVFGTIAPETVATLKKVAEAGNAGNNPDGTGVPNTPVEFQKISVS
jgi:peptidyl-prolyl cis-trans isomerase B (cyclophilin B)